MVVKDTVKLVDTVPEISPLVVTDPALLLVEPGCKELLPRLVPAVVPLPVLLIDDVLPETLLFDPVPPVLQVCKELLPRLLVPRVTVLLILELLIDTVLPVLDSDKELLPELVVPEVVAPLLVIGTPACPANISEPST